MPKRTLALTTAVLLSATHLTPAMAQGVPSTAGAIGGTALGGLALGGAARTCLKHKIVCGTVVALGGLSALAIHQARKNQVMAPDAAPR